MPGLRVHNLAVSIDGYAAGPSQSLDNPLGVGGPGLHEWAFATRAGRQMHGMNGGDEGLDDEFVARGNVGIGATIMGRNMFGPIRGPWGSDRWTGWWGDNPPFHHPVFVLTHHARASISMHGGTTFHFVDDGIEAARERAFNAAGGGDVRVGGGAATIQQYLRAGLIDELHLVIVPVLLRRGERLFEQPRRRPRRLRMRRVRQLALRRARPLRPGAQGCQRSRRACGTVNLQVPRMRRAATPSSGKMMNPNASEEQFSRGHWQSMNVVGP